MKPILLICTLTLAILLTACNGANGNYDLHKTLALVMILGIILLFFILSIYSNMLRDQVTDCTDFTDRSKNPYSLSRVQLAVWTVIIGSSYIYLQFCKGDCDITDVNQTALILMGIGASVTATGSIMDSRDIQNNVPRHQNEPSQGFFIDILSDPNGICIHRFQNVVWTVIAMTVYLTKVCAIKTGCALPDLSGTILALTGISNATYLAVKSQENTSIPPANTVGGSPAGGNPSTIPATASTAPAAPVVIPAVTVTTPVINQPPVIVQTPAQAPSVVPTQPAPQPPVVVPPAVPGTGAAGTEPTKPA